MVLHDEKVVFALVPFPFCSNREADWEGELLCSWIPSNDVHMHFEL